MSKSRSSRRTTGTSSWGLRQPPAAARLQRTGRDHGRAASRGGDLPLHCRRLLRHTSSLPAAARWQIHTGRTSADTHRAPRGAPASTATDVHCTTRLALCPRTVRPPTQAAEEEEAAAAVVAAMVSEVEAPLRRN